MAGKVVEVGDRIVDGDEPLKVSGGFETLHDPLSPPRWQMRILGPVVEAFVLAMLEGHSHPRAGGGIGTELVGDHHPWRAGLLSDQLAQEFFGGAAVPTGLNQSVKNEAIGVDRAPEPMLLAVDRDHDLIEMPFVAELRSPTPDLVGVDPAEFLRPRPHCLVADDDPARRQQIFDHPQAEGKSEIQPNGVLDDLRREPVAAINGVCRLDHQRPIANIRRNFVNLTVPRADRRSSAPLWRCRQSTTGSAPCTTGSTAISAATFRSRSWPSRSA